MDNTTTASTTTRVVLAAAAVGAAGYAYYYWTQQQMKNNASSSSSSSSSSSEGIDIPAEVAAAAAAAAAADTPAAASSSSVDDDDKNEKTFEQTPEQMEEMQRQAAVHMARLQAAGNMGQDGMGGMKNLSPEECGGVTDKYRWLQSETEVIVEFPIPKGTKSKQIVVKLETKNVKMAVNGETVLVGKPLRDIVPDECMWEIEEMPESKTGAKKVVVTLHKSKVRARGDGGGEGM